MEPKNKLYGTTQTLEMLDGLFSLASALDKSLEDGELDFSDLIHFYPVIPKLTLGIKNGDQIPKELTDLDEWELNKIKDYISEKFDISDDVLEHRIEEALKLLLSLHYFIYGLIQDLKKK